MTSLTDRYVWAAARTLPETQRAEFDRELRERIGDATDALVETGSSPPTPSAPRSPSSATRRRSPRSTSTGRCSSSGPATTSCGGVC